MAPFPFFCLFCASSLLLPLGPHTSTPVLLHPRDSLLGHLFHHHLFALCSHLRLEVPTGPIAEGPVERRVGLGWTKCPRGHFPVRPSLCFLFVNFLSLGGSLSEFKSIFVLCTFLSPIAPSKLCYNCGHGLLVVQSLSHV